MNAINLNNKKAVIYCRVSTKEQVDEGNSLSTQEKICREYCFKNGYEIAEIFIEKGESAKTSDRTELRNLLAYCSDKRNGVKALIIYKLDRLSRNTDAYSELRVLFKKYGVEIKSTSEYFENNPVGRFMENTMANIAQFDNDIRTERSVGGMKEAMRDGRYVWKAPIGYDNTKVAGRCTIAQNPITAPLMKRAFELIAQNQYSIQDVRRLIAKEGLISRKGQPLSVPYFYRLLTNEAYSGWIIKFGEKHKGLFEPIITDELFNQVQRVLKRRGRKNSQYLTDNPDFPLRRFILNENGKKLTGSWSKGRYRKYPFYRFGGNSSNYNRDKFELAFMEYIDQYSFDNTKLKRLKELVKENLMKATLDQRKERDRLTKCIKDLEEKQTGIIKKNLDGVIPDSVLTKQIELIDKELFEVQTILTSIPDTETNYEEALSFIEEYLKTPSKIWRKAKIGVQLKLQWFQFPQGLVFKNNIFGTTEISSLFKVKKPISNHFSSKVPLRNERLNNPKITIDELDTYNYIDSPVYWQKVGVEILRLTEILKETKEYP